MARNKPLVFLLLALSALPALRGEEAYQAPRAREFVAVLSVNLIPAPDDAFFSRYNNLEGMTLTMPRTKETKVASTFVLELGNLDLFAKNATFAPLGQMASERFPVPKSREVTVKGLTAYLADIGVFYVSIPFPYQFTVPEGATYLYLGTVDVTWTGYQFTVTDVKLRDEFDRALKVVKERYGKDATLVRARLQPLKP